jgi:hypothetical protein
MTSPVSLDLINSGIVLYFAQPLGITLAAASDLVALAPLDRNNLRIDGPLQFS